MIAHVPVILRQCQTGIQARLTGCHRHIGGIGDQRGAVHQRIACFRIDQLGKLLQNLRHLVSALAAADINDDVRVRPFCDLVLSHGLPGTETARDCRRAALG